MKLKLINKLNINLVNQLKLIMKISCIALSLVLFFGAMFVAMNETQKTIDGKAVSVLKIENGVQLTVGDKVYQIEKDSNTIKLLKEYISNNHYLYPFGVNVIKTSDTITRFIINACNLN